MLGKSDLWMIRARAEDYRRRFENGEVTTLAYDICGIDIPALLADETELRSALAAADARCREAQERAVRCEAAMQGAISLMEKAPDADNTFSAWLNLRAAIGVLNAALAPPDAGGTATPGREQMLVSLVREVLDREPVYLHDGATSNDDTCCVFCDAATHSDVDDGNPHEADCWIVRADAVVNAYSPDAGGAKEQE